MNAVAVNDDADLIRRCVNGDQVAWKDLIVRYERLVYSVALTCCRQSADASDIFQEVWMELYHHLSDLRHSEALPSWLITVTKRRAYKLIRSRRSSQPLDQDLPDVNEPLNRIEREHVVERALAHLGERCRQLVELLYFSVEDASYATVATKLFMPIASIGPTRARCLEKLRKIVGAT